MLKFCIFWVRIALPCSQLQLQLPMSWKVSSFTIIWSTYITRSCCLVACLYDTDCDDNKACIDGDGSRVCECMSSLGFYVLWYRISELVNFQVYFRGILPYFWLETGWLLFSHKIWHSRVSVILDMESVSLHSQFLLREGVLVVNLIS